MSRVLDAGAKRELAWEAATLFERLAVHPPGSAPADCGAADEFVATWREAYAGGVPDAFERRLAAGDLSESACRECVCRDAWPAAEPLPDWVDDLDALLSFVDEFGDEPAAGQSDDRRPGDGRPGDVRPDDRDEPYPFEGVFEPWVAFAAGRLVEATPDRSASAVDHGSLRAWLFERLIEVAVEAVYVEFETFVSMREPALRFGDGAADATGTEQYDAFVDRMRSADGLASLFGTYPVLGRFVVTTVRQWVDSVAEFHDRLDADRERLDRTFAPADGLGSVVDVTALTDDRHGDGRAVFRVRFDAGVRVAYKPRPVEAGRLFHRTLAWLGDRPDVPGFETPSYVSREEYGWMEWIPHEACESAAALDRYYRRAGALLAVAYVLGLTDCQFENVVASGDRPVVVDAETVAQPAVEADVRERPVYDEIRGSVVFTSLLPWQADEGPDRDVSAFGAAGIEARQPLHDPVRWDGMNADGVALADGAFAPETGRNLPSLDGEVRPAGEHPEAVLDGFERAYRRLVADREALLADDGPLAAFAGVETRFLYASTDQYYTVLRAITSPDSLDSGLRTTERTEKLYAHHFADDGRDEAFGRVHLAERAALERLDVPRLAATPGDTDVFHDSTRIEDALDVSGLDGVRGRLDALDPGADLPKQRDYVRLALGGVPGDVPTGPVESVAPDATEGTAGTVDLAERATGIADDVAETAVTDGDGELAWLLREKYDADAPMSVRFVGDGLYAGRGGIALFFAGLDAVSDDDGYREWAFDALAPLRDRLDADAPFGDAGVGGAAEGVGSAVYALRTVGLLLDDDGLLADARRAARHLTAGRVEDDDHLDVVGGAAGGALSLLSLYEECGDDWLLARATACGDHLLDERAETPTGHRAWRTGVDDRFLTGFSHGAAGIAYALARLADATGASRFADAALEAVEYEHACYDETHGNWPDLRDGEAAFMDAWCHGRSGVGVARVGTREFLDAGAVRTDLRRAVDERRTGRVGRLDNLCCGNAGRIEFLVEAGSALDESGLFDEARSLGRAVLGRAADRGCFSLQSHTPRLYDPTLFQGTAGVGYALLRAANPDALPCLLRWE